jgi:hypothetical protein
MLNPEVKNTNELNDNHELKAGDEIEFTYKGSQENFFNTRQKGRIVMTPHVSWQGGTCPLEDYAENAVKLEKETI